MNFQISGKAPRCGAKTRKGTPCQAPAMANGGCSPGAPLGNKNALKHGHYTKKALEQHKRFRELLNFYKKLKEML